MTWREFIYRSAAANWLDDEQPIWEDDAERSRRKVEYRFSNNYKRTFRECIRLDLKVLARVLKRRIRNGKERVLRKLR